MAVVEIRPEDRVLMEQISAKLSEILRSRNVIKDERLKEIVSVLAKVLEDIIESLEVLSSRELVEEVRQSLRDARKGRTRPLKELTKELGFE